MPAQFHNRPHRIPAGVQKHIEEARQTHERTLVVYGDCGTGGKLDELLETEGVIRVEGPHCYEMYAGAASASGR